MSLADTIIHGQSSLKEIILDQIDQNGPIPISTYMQLCLQHPTHGYYTSKNAPIGQDGDFTTAPEVSQMFGETVALWIIERWQALGRPDSTNLLELGPGRGTLMSDILRTIKQLSPDMYQGLTVTLVESSQSLSEAQQEALSEHQKSVKIQSSDHLLGSDKLPDGPVIILANEFFDALPIRQFKKGEKGWREVMIGASDGETLEFITMQTKHAAMFSDILTARAQGQDFIEISTVTETFVTDITALLKKRFGAALIIDYGYLQEPHGNTLQALSQHKRVSPLSNPGEDDITAHVDFYLLAKRFHQLRLTSHTLWNQGDFLKAYGIEARLEQLMKTADTPNKKADIPQQYHRLVDNDKMGLLFKVLAVQHDQPKEMN